ncbi:unnamed protein product [Cochlearia groenlandica]
MALVDLRPTLSLAEMISLHFRPALVSDIVVFLLRLWSAHVYGIDWIYFNYGRRRFNLLFVESWRRRGCALDLVLYRNRWWLTTLERISKEDSDASMATLGGKEILRLKASPAARSPHSSSDLHVFPSLGMYDT